MPYRKLALTVLAFCSLLPFAHAQSASGNASLSKLMQGNKRFASGSRNAPNRTVSRRSQIAPKQHPFAVVVCCSDSRVPPELVFNQGLGDLFVVRVAGNVVDDVALGSIEYAVEHLGARFIFVLGHQSCGAVDAALAGGEHEGHVGSILHLIEPAIEATKGQAGNRLENATKENVRLVVSGLRSSDPVLTKWFNDHRLAIAGGYYNLHTGKITLVK